MNVLDELREIMEDAEKKVPFSHDRVREDLDFRLIPKLVYDDGDGFVSCCLHHREEYICELFNNYYDSMNPVYYPLEPRHFEKGDFMIGSQSWSKDQRFLLIALPEETGHSRNFCIMYILSWIRNGDHAENVRFFAVMNSDYGWARLGEITREGEVITLGKATGNLKEELDIIAKRAFGS